MRQEEIISNNGYVLVYLFNANGKGYNYIKKHILLAESVLGRYLKKGECVHHCDENPKNNQNNNLVICQNVGYHNFLHLRMRSFKATGDPHKRKCKYCRKWDDKANLYIMPDNKNAWHRKCYNEYYRSWYRKTKMEVGI